MWNDNDMQTIMDDRQFMIAKAVWHLMSEEPKNPIYMGNVHESTGSHTKPWSHRSSPLHDPRQNV